MIGTDYREARVRIEQLQYLEAIVEHGSFRAASRALGVSQPTLSQQIRRLEQELGLQLLHRDYARTVITPELDVLALDVRAVLDAQRRLVERARALRSANSDTLRIGAIPTLSRVLLGRVLARFRATHNDASFEVHEDGSLALWSRLSKGDLHMALLSSDVDDPLGPGFASVELFRDKPVLVVSKKHPLAKHRSVRIKDVASENWIIQGEGYSLRRTLFRLAGGSDLNILYESNSSAATLHLVAANMGIAVLGIFGVMAGDALDRESVALLPISDAREIVLRVAWRRDYAAPTPAYELRSLISEFVVPVKERLRPMQHRLGFERM